VRSDGERLPRAREEQFVADHANDSVLHNERAALVAL